MSLPHATTTVTVLRAPDADRYAEPYTGADPGARQPAAQGVRAVLDAPGGSEAVAGGEQTVIRFHLLADPCDLRSTDWVRDDTSGLAYRVVWALPLNDMAGRPHHVEAAVELVEGLV